MDPATAKLIRADEARAGQSSADQLRGCGIHVKISFQIL
jgi:hypothetical protein